MTTTLEPDHFIAQAAAHIVGLLNDAKHRIQEAGRFIAENQDKDPLFFDKVHKMIPDLTLPTLRLLASIGRGQVLPDLFSTHSPGLRKLRDCDISVQKRLMTEPVELVIRTETGTDVLLVPVSDLSRDQTRQVFDRHGSIRSVAQQNLYLADRFEKAVVQPWKDHPWRKVPGGVEIGGIKLTKTQILQMLKDAQ